MQAVSEVQKTQHAEKYPSKTVTYVVASLLSLR